MSLRRDQAGWTLIELLIGASLMLVIMGAALTVFERFTVTTADNASQNDAQETARATSAQLARQLRNLAGPTNGQPQAFDSIGSYDIVFETVNPVTPPLGQANASNIERVRYCLDAASPAHLWVQTQTWTGATPPSVPSTSTCPSSSWNTQRVGASYITNNRNGQNRPVFAFDSSSPATVTQVRTNLYIDRDPTHWPPETQLETGVFLRNQNRAPTAVLQANPGNQGNVILNASASSDPEGQPLTYAWSDNGTKLASTSAVWAYQTTSGHHSIRLDVFDPAGLSGNQTQDVVVP